MKLIFVYNADGKLFSKITDFAHKIISPSTYNCSLCTLTFGNFGMKEEWANFIKTIPAEIEFLHKDEFTAKYEGDFTEFPLILKQDKGDLSVFLSATEINACPSLTDLEGILNKKLEEAKL